MMIDPDAISQQQDLLASYRRTLAHYLQQQASLTSLYAPPSVLNGILETRANIRRVKDILRGWGILIVDHPDDEVSPADSLDSADAPTASQGSHERIVTFTPPAGDLSPFVVGPPISHARYFFGRERELRRLFNLWRRPPLQNAAIIGPRRSGKTSLLMYIQQITTMPRDQLRADQRSDWLAAPERFRWIFVDFQDPRMGYRTELLRYILDRLELPHPSPCNLNTFINTVSDNVRTPTIILMDEIGTALQRYPELNNSFWEGLRALSTHQVQGNLGFVLAAHEPPEQLARHSSLGSPFFNIFGYSATLGPLTETEARQLIASAQMPFPETDIEWILGQSQGWPVLIQVLCRERLLALEYGETGAEWREEGLRQMSAFRHLLGDETAASDRA